MGAPLFRVALKRRLWVPLHLLDTHCLWSVDWQLMAGVIILWRARAVATGPFATPPAVRNVVFEDAGFGGLQSER